MADFPKIWSPFVGAVSLTFDDGTANQLAVAVPLLAEYGLKATFYITPNDPKWNSQQQSWQAVAAAGHEIGNHTLSHFCSNNIKGESGGLEDKNLSEIEADILAAQERLVRIAPQQPAWTFAYPCYSTDVGRGLQRQSYVPIVAKYFLAGRSSGEYGFGNHPALVDLAALWGTPTERMSGFEMIGLIEEIFNAGKWLILIFHEISGNYLTVSSSDLRQVLAYLQERKHSIWTAPVGQIARQVADYQKSLSASI